MRFLLKILVILFCLTISQKAWSQIQKIDPQQLVAEIIEELSSKTDIELDFTPIIEDLLYLSENPLLINLCSVEDISRLVFLSDFQVQSLWDYIQTNGSILSIYEIQLVNGFDQSDVAKMTPFISFSKPTGFSLVKNIFWKGRHEVTIKTGTVLENSVGYQYFSDPNKSRYLGSKQSLSTRYTYQSAEKVEWGINADKDPGEQFFKGSNSKGFDYLSGYFSVSKVGKIKKLIVGDFDAGFGQGLTFWSSLSAGKSSDPMGIRKRARGLTKHSSTNENTFLRGVGVTIPMKRYEFTAFGSYKKVDANLSDSIINGESYFTSLPESGLHRTFSELENRNILGEFITGGNISYKGKSIKGGLTFSHIKIDGNYIADSTPYKLFEPSITGRTNLGVNLEGYVKNHHLFGEAAIIPSNGEHVILVGGLFKLSSLVHFSILARSYSRGYTNSYVSAFAESSGSNNENGIFSGISILLTKGLNLSAYLDVFSFPWLRYRVNSPSSGYEYMLQTDFQFSSSFTGEVRYRLKKSEQNFTSELSQVITVIPQRNQSARLQFNYTPEKMITLRSRIDFSSFSSDSTKEEFGFIFSQDIGFAHPKYPFSVAVRFAIFDTDSWSTRIYSYESDLLYSFSVPAYYSKGTRTYIMIKYSPTNRIDCWLRWSQTYYSDMNEIGQGLDLISGNKKNDIRIMVRVKF